MAISACKCGFVRALTLVIFALAAIAGPASSFALVTPSNSITLTNPNWEIDLTDFGYSDYLGDQTPGFVGREYLSGEWAGAVSYTVGDSNHIAPTWLEPNFIYPDWNTNSNFAVESAIQQTGTNAQGLPIAQSVISNGDLRITQTFEMIDTIVGTPLGNSPASAATGSFIASNRYVLKQTYAIENISGDDINNLQFFQFLHGLTAQRGVYDNRNYTGPLSDYQYDTTLNGVDDTWADPTNPNGFLDYIGFGASVAPSANELGYYGIDNNGVDNHATGKPSVGTHLSVEANALDGTDAFNPATRWVAGAQRYDLTSGTLTDGSSIDLSVILFIRSGTQVTGGDTTGGANGGSSNPGGCDFQFDDPSATGSFYANYHHADESEVLYLINQGEFTDPSSFLIPGSQMQLWELDFEGEFSGALHLIFSYDPLLLPEGFDQSTLAIYHFHNGTWQLLTGPVDTLNHTISVTVYDLSPFAVGVNPIPEPATAISLAALAIFSIVRRRRAQ